MRPPDPLGEEGPSSAGRCTPTEFLRSFCVEPERTGWRFLSIDGFEPREKGSIERAWRHERCTADAHRCTCVAAASCEATCRRVRREGRSHLHVRWKRREKRLGLDVSHGPNQRPSHDPRRCRSRVGRRGRTVSVGTGFQRRDRRVPLKHTLLPSLHTHVLRCHRRPTLRRFNASMPGSGPPTPSLTAPVARVGSTSPNWL